jgi:hypothetical protein
VARRSLDDLGDFQQPNEGYLVDLLPDMPFERVAEHAGTTILHLEGRGLHAGSCDKEALTAALNKRCAMLVEESIALAADYEPVSLLTGLVAAHESLRICFGAIPSAVTGKLPLEAPLVESARFYATVAPSLAISLRLAIELFSARPPSGSRKASKALVTELWAYTYEILNVGTVSDLIHYDVLPSKLSAGPDGLALPEFQASEEAQADRSVQFLGGVGNPLLTLFGRRNRTLPVTKEEEAKEQALVDRLAAATAQVAGVDLPTCVEIITSLAGLAGLQPAGHPNGFSPGGINRSSEDVLVKAISLFHREDPENVRRLLRFLCIEPKPDYPDPTDKPWVFDRQRSYQARPLVRVPGERDLVWSGYHTYCSAEVIIGQLAHNSLPGVDRLSHLGQAMNELSEWRGEHLEAKVLDIVRSDLRLHARKIDTLSGKKLTRSNGEDLGDIDALAAEPRSRTLLNVEVKAIEPGRTPREIASEIERLTVTNEASTYADRVLERGDVIASNLDDALGQLGVQSSADGWRVRSLFVLETPPFAGKLCDVGIPVISYDELTQLDLAEWIAALP